MKLSHLGICIAVLGTGLATAIHAEETQLQPVHVTADTVAPWQTHIDPHASHRAHADVGDGLRDQPGVDAIRMGGRGLDPVIRGQSQNRLNVLLDGAYVFNACPNRMDPPTLYAAEGSYDQITVIRGVHTLRYGPGGSGGTVLLERTRPQQEDAPYTTGNLYSRYQDNGSGRLFGANLIANGDTGYLRAFGEYAKAGNYDDGDNNTVFSAYQARQGGLLAGLHLGPESFVEIGAERASERDVLYAGAGMDSPESDSETLSLRAAYRLNPDWLLRTDLHYNRVAHLMDNYSLRPLPAMVMFVPSSSDTWSGRLEGETGLGEGSLRVGANYIENRRDATLYNGMLREVALMWPDVTIRQLGLFAETRQPLTERATLSGGVRLDRAKSRAYDTDQRPTLMMPWVRTPAQLYTAAYGTSGNLDHNELLSGAFLRYELARDTGPSFFASASRAQRLPDATERYFARSVAGNRDQWIGNPNLKPETHHQLDLGLHQDSARFDYQLTLFADRVSDFIYRENVVQGPVTRSQYRNIYALIYGAEADLGVRYGTGHETRLQLSHRRGDNRTDHTPLSQIAPINGELSQHYRHNLWHYTGTVRFAAGQNRINRNSGEQKTPGYAVLDLRLEKSWQTLTVSAGVDNVFDTAYADFLNRNRAANDPLALVTLVGLPVTEPGRSLWAGFDYRF